VQLFGSALNANPHVHIIALDGVFRRRLNPSKFGEMEFVRNWLTTDASVSSTLWAIAEQVDELLKKTKGFSLFELQDQPALSQSADEDGNSQGEDFALLATQGSLLKRVTTGKHRGNRLRTDGKGTKKSWGGVNPLQINVLSPKCVMYRYFTMHAATAVEGDDPRTLERLLRYVARPAFSDGRLSLRDPEQPEGDLKYRLKADWDDGSQHIFLSPTELMEKLVALVPPRYLNLIRFWGILGPNHYLRSRVTPTKKRMKPKWWRDRDAQEELAPPQDKVPVITTPKKPKRSLLDQLTGGASGYWIPWSVLLQRVFRVHADQCPKCGSTLRAVDAVMVRSAIVAILTHIGEDAYPPARGPPETRSFELEYECLP
jgi:hypothetical protein